MPHKYYAQIARTRHRLQSFSYLWNLEHKKVVEGDSNAYSDTLVPTRHDQEYDAHADVTENNRVLSTAS